MRATDCGNPGSFIYLCNFMENVAGEHLESDGWSKGNILLMLLYSFVATYIITISLQLLISTKNNRV